MRRKHHISQSSYQMLFDYLAKFPPIEDKDFHPHLELTLVGWFCGAHDEKLHEEGTVLKKSWFITRGMVYLCFVDKDKGEIVFRLFRAGEIAVIPDSFMNGKPSTCYVMACAHTELLEMSKQEMDLIHKTFPQSLALENAILATISEKARERDSLLWLEAEERILSFFKLYPELHPDHKTIKMLDMNIASYLHMDKSHYCRLKNNLYPKKKLEKIDNYQFLNKKELVN